MAMNVSFTDKENLTMNRSSYLLIFAAVLSFCAAIFQAAIAFVPAWSDAFGAGTLASNPPLLLASGLTVALLLAIWGLYGLSGAGVIRRLPLLRLGLLMIGLLYLLVGINFPFQVLAMLGILPTVGPIPIHIVLVSLGAFVAALAYLIGLAAWSLTVGVLLTILSLFFMMNLTVNPFWPFLLIVAGLALLGTPWLPE